MLNYILIWQPAAFLVLLPLALPAGAESTAEFDLTYFEENYAFEKEISEDGESVWFQTRTDAEKRAFSTPYDNDTYYSVIFPELAVRNYPRPAERDLPPRRRSSGRRRPASPGPEAG